MEPQQVMVPLETGASLYCEVYNIPDAATSAVALLFHPWAWLGGSLHDPVVHEMCRHAVLSRHFSTVVRYDVRGNGRSTGFKAWTLETDAADATALARHFLRQQTTRQTTSVGGPASTLSVPSSAPPQLALLAYSFGSCIAAQVAQRCPETTAYASIGFPLGLLSRMFLGSHAAWKALWQADLGKYSSSSHPNSSSSSSRAHMASNASHSYTVNKASAASNGTATTPASHNSSAVHQRVCSTAEFSMQTNAHASADNQMCTGNGGSGGSSGCSRVLPKLFVLGTNDQFTAVRTLRELVCEAEAAAADVAASAAIADSARENPPLDVAAAATRSDTAAAAAGAVQGKDDAQCCGGSADVERSRQQFLGGLGVHATAASGGSAEGQRVGGGSSDWQSAAVGQLAQHRAAVRPNVQSMALSDVFADLDHPDRYAAGSNPVGADGAGFDVRIVQGCDHFFRDCDELLGYYVVEWAVLAMLALQQAAQRGQH